MERVSADLSEDVFHTMNTYSLPPLPLILIPPAITSVSVWMKGIKGIKHQLGPGMALMHSLTVRN